MSGKDRRCQRCRRCHHRRPHRCLGNRLGRRRWLVLIANPRSHRFRTDIGRQRPVHHPRPHHRLHLQ